MAKDKASKSRQQNKRRQKRAAKSKVRAKVKSKRHLTVVEDDGLVADAVAPVLPDRRAMEGFMSGLVGGAGESPIDEAQQLMYEAWDAPNARAAVKLARQALEVSPDCADAYNLLAEQTDRDLEQAAELYQKGVEAGERALGARAFEEDVGHFWGLLETRPYMRARAGLAQCLWGLDKKDEAIHHHVELLRLNPGDNQGIRHGLAAWLLEQGRDEALVALLDQYDDDCYAGWPYTRALLAFRTAGDAPAARKLLVAAIEANPHVPAYLLGKKKMPRHLPDYIGVGDEQEAIAFCADFAESWERAPGALSWLKENWNVDEPVVAAATPPSKLRR